MGVRKIILAATLFIGVQLHAQSPIEIPLWPDGAPNSNGLQGTELQAGGGRVSNVSAPVLFVYKSPKPDSKAIIICPGGGYARLAMNHEGHDMAPWFTAQNITYIVLKYRMPNGNHEVPLSDAEQAIRYVRRHAAELNVNPAKVGIMGASAGGHLASTLATRFGSKDTRPDFQILLYPVITMDANHTHWGSRENLIGKEPAEELVRLYSNELQVTKDTPKAFIALSSDDESVAPANGINYYTALLQNDVPAALLTYPTGGHGWGFRDDFAHKQEWTEALKEWLRREL